MCLIEGPSTMTAEFAVVEEEKQTEVVGPELCSLESADFISHPVRCCGARCTWSTWF